MQEEKLPKEKKQIDHHIFNGSIALIAVCITVISLFRVTKTGKDTFADEVMGAATIIFIASAGQAQSNASYPSFFNKRSNEVRTAISSSIIKIIF